MRLGATAIASAGPTSPGERSASFRDGEHHYRCSPHFLFAGNTLMDRDSVVNDMARRVEELDQLLSRYMPPPPSDNPSGKCSRRSRVLGRAPGGAPATPGSTRHLAAGHGRLRVRPQKINENGGGGLVAAVRCARGRVC